MKKSTFILILKILVAVAGAIVATLTAQSCSVTHPSAATFHATRDSIFFNYSDSTINR